MIQLFFDKTDERWGEKRPSHRELYSNFGCGKLHHFRPAGLVFGFWDDVQKFIALKSAFLSAQMHLDNHKTYKICKEYTCFPSIIYKRLKSWPCNKNLVTSAMFRISRKCFPAKHGKAWKSWISYDSNTVIRNRNHPIAFHLLWRITGRISLQRIFLNLGS